LPGLFVIPECWIILSAAFPKVENTQAILQLEFLTSTCHGDGNDWDLK